MVFISMPGKNTTWQTLIQEQSCGGCDSFLGEGKIGVSRTMVPLLIMRKSLPQKPLPTPSQGREPTLGAHECH
jgi:hypothetical protein